MSIHIALVEDDESYRTLLADLLEQMDEVRGVSSFETGEAFLHALPDQDFHLALLDVELPGISGLEILDTLRKNDVRLPAVILSNSTSQRNVDQAYDSGARGYLVKPLALEELEDLLQDLVHTWARMRAPATAVAATNS